MERFKRELDSFRTFELRRSGVAYYAEIVNARKENALNVIDDRIERVLDVLKIHPSFGRFFNRPLEEGAARKKEELDMLRPYGMLRGELIGNMEVIIKEIKGILPMLFQYVELDRIFTDKVVGLADTEEKEKEAVAAITSPNLKDTSSQGAEPQRMGSQAWGDGKGDKAYLMAVEGRSYEEIAERLEIEKSAVKAYINVGIKKGIRLGKIEPPNRDANQLDNQKND